MLHAKAKLETPAYMEAYDIMLSTTMEVLQEREFQAALAELEVLSEAWQAKELVIEAGGKVEMDATTVAPTQRQVGGIIGTLKEFFRKVAQFITDAFEKFSDAMGEILKTDVEYINQHAGELLDISDDILQTMKITVVPYFAMQTHKRLMEPNLPTNGGSINNIIQRVGRSADKNITADWVYKTFFNAIAKYDEANYRNGALGYYRGGQPATTVISNPNAIHTAIYNMVEYVQNYKKYADSCKRTKDLCMNMMKESQNTLNQLESEYTQMSNTTVEGQRVMFGPEQFSLLEDAHLWDTEFGEMRYVDEVGNPYFKEMSKDDIVQEISWFNLSAKNNQGGAGAKVNGTNNFNTPYQRAVNNTNNAYNGQGYATPQDPQQQQQPKTVQQAQQQNNQQNNQQQPKATITFKNDAQKQKALKTNSMQQQKVRQIMAVWQVATAVVTAKLTVCEEVEKHYMRILTSIVNGLHKGKKEDERNAADQEHNEQREEARERQREEYRQRGETRKIRRRASMGKIRKGWDWLFGD